MQNNQLPIKNSIELNDSTSSIREDFEHHWLISKCFQSNWLHFDILPVSFIT